MRIHRGGESQQPHRKKEWVHKLSERWYWNVVGQPWLKREGSDCHNIKRGWSGGMWVIAFRVTNMRVSCCWLLLRINGEQWMRWDRLVLEVSEGGLHGLQQIVVVLLDLVLTVLHGVLQRSKWGFWSKFQLDSSLSCPYLELHCWQLVDQVSHVVSDDCPRNLQKVIDVKS